MSVHDKMQTDYVWVRDHSSADDWVKARYHNASLLYSSHFSSELTVNTIYTTMSPTREKDLK